MSESVVSKRRGIAPPLSAAAMHRRPKPRPAVEEKSPTAHARPVQVGDMVQLFGDGWTKPHTPDQERQE